MSAGIELSSYVSSGKFADDIRAMYPCGPFSPAYEVSDEDLERMTSSIPSDAKRELFALAALGRVGRLPKLGRENQTFGLETLFQVGYSLADDFGDELPDMFEDPGTPVELAKTAIGLAVNGGGVMHFLLNDGHVACLSMEAFHQWMWARFASLGEYLWVVLHGRAAAAGRFPTAEVRDVIAELGCELAAQCVDVPRDVLPPLPEPPEDPPPWLV